MNKQYIKIGEILEDGEIERGKTTQGMVFKDEEAYKKKSGVCYVPELSDVKYTYKDFLELANNNQKVADLLFYMVDWQSPESLYNDLIQNDELIEDDEYELKSISVEWDIEDIKFEMKRHGVNPTEENIQKVIDNGLHNAIEESMKQAGWDAINTVISDTF